MKTLTLQKTIEYFHALGQSDLWADPDAALLTVCEKLKYLHFVNNSDPVINIGSWNAEYLTALKANHFMSCYQQIIKRHHLLALQEISPSGLSTISHASGYQHFVSSANSRGQAVGFLLHPRFQVTAMHEYSEVAAVYGIHDLRPALQIDIFDPQNKTNLSVITVHLKSMLGGLAVTGRVRRKQLENLLLFLKDPNQPTVILGDFNCFLDTSADTSLLLDQGFNICNPDNHTSTQIRGGRLDGLFYKNLGLALRPKNYNIRNFWRASLAGRSLSDHGLLTWKIANI